MKTKTGYSVKEKKTKYNPSKMSDDEIYDNDGNDGSYSIYHIHKDGHKVGEFSRDHYFGQTIGKLHGKRLPHNLGQWGSIEKFVTSKTGQKFLKNIKEETVQLIKEKWRGMSYPRTVYPHEDEGYAPNKEYKKNDSFKYKGKTYRVIHVIPKGTEVTDAASGRKKIMKRTMLNIQEADDNPTNYDRASKIFVDAKGRKYRLTKDGKHWYLPEGALGGIKALVTGDEEEKRMEKLGIPQKVLTKDQRNKLQKLQDIAKYNKRDGK